MRILFTSAGRRGYLLDYFREAIGADGRLFAANSEPASSFLHADDAVITPLIHSPEYITFLLSYCEKHQINAVIPLFDVDLPVLARSKPRFADAGITVVVSNPEIVNICNDKLATKEFLCAHGFATPTTFASIDDAVRAIESGQLTYPVVVKPRWGMGSIGVVTAEDEDELIILYKRVSREVASSYLRFESQVDIERSVLVQQKIIADEYGLDVVNDLNGSPVTAFVKRKLAMRAGETDIAVTVDDAELRDLSTRLSLCLKHVGNLDVDVLKHPEATYVLELNNRFGGGYPFSHISGAHLPNAIVAWLAGEEPNPNWLSVTPGILGIKDFSLVKLEGSAFNLKACALSERALETSRTK